MSWWWRVGLVASYAAKVMLPAHSNNNRQLE